MADVTIRAVAPGECDVTVSSVADPSKSAVVHVTVEASKNLLRWGPASTRVESLGNTCEATVNEDGSLHIVAHVQTARQTLVSWLLDPAALGGRAVYMSQEGADAAKLRVGVYGGSSFNLYADAAGTVPEGLATLQLLVYASEAGDYELDLRPQLEEGAAKTDWERPDDVSSGGGLDPVNLIPGFSDMSSFANAKGFTATTDGWARLEVDNSSGTKMTFANFMTLPLPAAPATATLLLEFRDVSGEGKVNVVTRETATQLRAAGDGDGQIQSRPVADGAARYALAATGAESPVALLNSYVIVSAGKSLSCEARLSLYEGDYQGAYVPYSGGGIARNLIPGFSDTSGFVDFSDRWASLGGGWGKVTLDNSGGAGIAFAPFASAPLSEVPEAATALLEVRNLTGDVSVNAAGSKSVASDATNSQLVSDGDNTFRADGSYRVALRPTGSAKATQSVSSRAFVAAGKSGSAEVRLSLYAGDYEGPYVPYAGGA